MYNNWSYKTIKTYKHPKNLKSKESKYNKFQQQSNLSDRILLFTSLVPTVVLESFVSSFHFFEAKYVRDLRSYLVLLIFGKERIQWCRRFYLDKRYVYKIFNCGWSFVRCTIVYCQQHVLDSLSFHWWESDSLQEILIRCTFIFEDVCLKPFRWLSRLSLYSRLSLRLPVCGVQTWCHSLKLLPHTTSTWMRLTGLIKF